MAVGVAENSWRLSVQEKDRSSTIRGEAGSVGAMVIRSPRGPNEPTKIYKGQEQRILDMFGTPSSTWPDIWEAIQYNYQDDLWLLGPYEDDAKLGGVLVSDTGTSALGDAGAIDHDGLSTYSFNSDNEYFVLTSKSPGTDYIGVKVSYNSTNGYFTIAIYKNVNGTYNLIEEQVVSLTSGTKDGFGKNIYIETVFEDHDHIQAKVNATADVGNGTVDDTTVVTFTGGDRGSAVENATLNTGWQEFYSLREYPADIFMCTVADSTFVTTFDTLRDTYQKYAFYILPLPSGENSTTATSTKDGYGVDNKGLAFYWNRIQVKDTYNDSKFWTSGIGRIGAKLAQMSDIYNAGAPAWIDENGHGGQLGSGIIKTEYDPTESELESLDNNGINAIVKYPSYGTMIVSHRTAQSPNTLSDNSWIAHRRLFDYIISNILRQVLTYQIVKLNDELHRRIAVSKGTTLMDPILADNFISDYDIQCDLNNNDDTAMAQRKFVYTLALKVTPYSEEIVLEFINVGQNFEVSEVIATA